MKRGKIIVAALLASMMMWTTGCGDPLYDLTDEEIEAIVSYSAHVIGKYNTYQNDGIVYVNPKSLEAEDASTVPEETESDIEDTTALNTSDSDSDDTDTSEDSDTSEEASDESGTDTDNGAVFGSGQTYNGQGYGSIENLTKALDLGQITAEYMGYEITSEYVQDEVFSMTADTGRDYFVIKIRLNNNSSNTYNIDLLSAKPRFRLLVDDESAGSAITTLLMNDLGTYQGELAPGESVDTVLLFSVIEGECDTFDSLGLSVTMNGTSNNILF